MISGGGWGRGTENLRQNKGGGGRGGTTDDLSP